MRPGVRRLATGMAVAGLVTVGLTGAVPAQAAVPPRHQGPAVPDMPASHGLGHLTTRKPHLKNPAASRAHATAVTWPSAASGIARLAAPAPLTPSAPLPLASALSGNGAMGGRGHAMAPGTPVWAERTTGSLVSGVAVRVLKHAAAAAAGVRGVVFTAAADGTAGRVVVGVNYSGFGQVLGGNYGLSLGLSELPACALTTPSVAACRKETPLPSLNDAASHSVSATLALTAPAVSSGQIVLAATPTPTTDGGPAGSYSATTLKPSSTWSAGGSSGAFDYTYPIAVPPAASGLVPSVSLSYDSGAVDGQTASTQAQSSWVGDGWSTPQAFIEQSFVACSDSPEGSAAPSATPDQCYNGPILTLVLNGASTPLVCPSPFSYTTTSTCVPSADDGAKVTHVVSSSNGSGTKFTDYWTVTERDGTTYDFGRNQLPGFASGDKTTNSVDSEPVFSAHSGDPCFSSSGFSASACTMAYRWNMDYVTDVHSDAMAFYYDQSANAYAEDGKTAAAVSYIRDSHLDHIDYGFTAGSAYSGHAPDEVVFTTGDRCFTGTCDPLNSTNAANWLDVPYANNCTAGSSCQITGPTFWSTVRLASISAQQWNGSAYAKVDSWALAQHFPKTGDATSPALWLDSITHTGSDTTSGGSSVTLPAVSFAGVDLANRLNPGNYPALDRYRIADITTESGEVIEVAYEQVSPCSTTSPPSPSVNTSSCFPVYWQQFTPPTPDWFLKYAVASVDQTDPTGGSPGVYTSYKYSGAAWHFDDNEVVVPKFRTYGQFRGYQDVRTFTGTGNDAQTESETTYYQGMSDDHNSTAVSLTDSQGSKHDDTLQLADRPLETTQYNFAGGAVDNSQIFSYWVSAAASTRTRSGLPALTANFTGQVEKWTRQAITDSSPATWRDTETDTSYDATPSDADFGLPLQVFDHGDLSEISQQTCTSTTYAAANAGENLVGLVAQAEVDAAACGGSNPGGASAPASGEINALSAPAGLSRPADVISDTRTFYDDPPVLSGGVPEPSVTTWPQAAPTAGDPSVVQKATNYSGSAFTYLTSAATTYDSFGRPTASYDANGNKTTTAYTMTNGVLTQQVVTNPLGQATSTSYDPMRGLATVTTDPNGIATTMEFDGLGRLTHVWLNGRATTAAANYLYSYSVSDSGPTIVTTQQLDEKSGYETSATLYDALLRVRQTQAPTPQGGILLNDSFYDSRGWLFKANMNYWDSSTTDTLGTNVITVPDTQVPNQTVTAFDGLGRPVLATSYDDSNLKSSTATAYFGDRVTTVPPLGATPTSTVTDALGRTTELDQYTSAPTVSTSVANGITKVAISGGATRSTGYLFNTRGEQSEVTTGGEDWNTTYNLLGQITATSSPDAGTTAKAYDDNGNVTSTTDAKGNTISYTYDALNRKTGQYDGPSSSSPPIATYVYDNANNAVSKMTDPIGQLTTETSYDGNGNAYIQQQNGFNAFGESAGQTWTIPAVQGALAGTYTQTNTYTAIKGLPVNTSYPASPGGGELPAETVENVYTAGFDLPNTVASNLDGYDEGTSYSALSQVAKQELGNTSNQAFVSDTYDPHTGALSDSQVAKTAGSGTPFDDTSYAYDAAGNITAETDDQNGTQTETQCYLYNTLDQLTQAWTGTDSCNADPSGNGGSTVGDAIAGSAYWTNWSFSALGERTTQTQHSVTGGQSTVTGYAYGTSQPDTLASTATTGPSGSSSTSYAYDPDGNTTRRAVAGGSQSLTWNDDGTLASASTPSGTTSYVYDATGHVLLQSDTGTGQNTLFVFGEQIVLNTATNAITGTRFIPLPGGADVVRTGAGSAYQFELTNQQGTGVLTLSATAQSPAWRQFTPYGAPRGAPAPSWPDTNGFLGQPTDGTTGLTIIGARQYDPSAGMFISPDPLLQTTTPSALNGYSYAGGNPVTNTDPSGELMIDSGGCIGSIQFCEGHTPNEGGGGGGGGGKSSCPDYDPGCPGFTGGGAGPSGETLLGPGSGSGSYTGVSRSTAAAPHPHTAPSTFSAMLCVRVGGSYCAGGPSKPTVRPGTFGICINGGIFGGPIFLGSLCFAMATNSAGNTQFGYVNSPGMDYGLPSASLTGSFFTSNATRLSQLDGPFANFEGSFGEGIVGTYAYQRGIDAANHEITTHALGAGLGGNTPWPWPFGLDAGVTTTVTHTCTAWVWEPFPHCY